MANPDPKTAHAKPTIIEVYRVEQKPVKFGTEQRRFLWELYDSVQTSHVIARSSIDHIVQETNK